jgi:chromosome segregation ATPase
MLKRILIIVLVVLFVVLGYFGMQQMQLTNQLKDNLASATQQVDTLKNTNMNLETAKMASDKKVDDLNMALQALQKQINDQQISAAAQAASINKLMEEKKVTQAQITQLQNANKKLETEKKILENKCQTQIQASEVKIKGLSDKLQHSESVPVSAPMTPAGIGAKL